MRYLFRSLNKLETFLAHKSVFLYLDYDGTVVAIRKRPAQAVVSKRVRTLLSALSKSPACRLCILSGRSLKDISRLVGLRNIIYGGNHGLELKGPRILFRTPVSKKHLAVLARINRNLRIGLREIKGVLVENKGLSLSVHYRLVAHRNIALVKAIFCQSTAIHLRCNEIRVLPGKMVLEVRPPVDWDKGRAVQWLLRKIRARRDVPVVPIYIGDDLTDENAFKQLKNHGLSIFVGKPGKSHAQYYVRDSREVLLFLSRLLNIIKPPGRQ